MAPRDDDHRSRERGLDDRPGRHVRRSGRVRGESRAVIGALVGPGTDAAARIGRHWRAESKTIRVGLVAHGISALTGLVAGLILASLIGTMERLPGFIVLVVASNSLRGMIFGAYGSRLGTSIQVGTFGLDLETGSVLRNNLVAVSVLSAATAPILALLAAGICAVFGLRAMSVWDFIVVATIGGALSSVLVGAFTTWVAWMSARRAWDLDTVSAPLVTMAGDVVGVPALALATLFAGEDRPSVTIGIVLLVATLGVCTAAWIRTSRRAREIVRQTTPVLLGVLMLDLIAGTVLQAQERRLFDSAVYLVILPAFLEALGGFGGMYSSRLSTKLHLGVVDVSPLPNQLAVLDSTLVLLFAVAILPVIAGAAQIIAAVRGIASPGALEVFAVTVSGGAVGTALAIMTGYYSAVSTVRFGLDPDDIALPITTATMDLLGVLCLAGALALLSG